MTDPIKAPKGPFWIVIPGHAVVHAVISSERGDDAVTLIACENAAGMIQIIRGRPPNGIEEIMSATADNPVNETGPNGARK